jgi:hypothetical protein
VSGLVSVLLARALLSVSVLASALGFALRLRPALRLRVWVLLTESSFIVPEMSSFDGPHH